MDATGNKRRFSRSGPALPPWPPATLLDTSLVRIAGPWRPDLSEFKSQQGPGPRGWSLRGGGPDTLGYREQS